jgi:hypothetical protein
MHVQLNVAVDAVFFLPPYILRLTDRAIIRLYVQFGTVELAKYTTDLDTPCSQRTASQSATARTHYIFVKVPESIATVSNHSRHCKLCLSQFLYMFVLLNTISVL